MIEDYCNIPVSYAWDTHQIFYDVRAWLRDNVENNCYRFAGTDPNDYNRSMVYFARKKDAIMFSLMWS